jgi:16S rRNA (adenine1518-N6/adenine1519-N6)-dimethyltransferase
VILSPSQIRALGIRTSKSLGQHFLIDERTLQRVVDAAELSPDDTVLEIGAGLGQLTEELGKRSKLVVAIEKDRRLGEFSRDKFKNRRNVKIVIRDALLFDPATLPRGYKLVGNLPYQITSPILRKFLEHENPPASIVITIQKEVGERVIAKPGSRDRGVLTVTVEFFGKAEIVGKVSRSAFWPQPEVGSVILRITPVNNQQRAINRQVFFRVVKAGFSAKRQKLVNALSRSLKLPKDQVYTWMKDGTVDPNSRAEDLDLDSWIRLAQKTPLNS